MKYVTLEKIDLANAAKVRNSLQRDAIRAAFYPLRVKDLCANHELEEGYTFAKLKL